MKKSTVTGSKDDVPALFPRDRRFIELHPVSTHEIVFYVDIRMSVSNILSSLNETLTSLLSISCSLWLKQGSNLHGRFTSNVHFSLHYYGDFSYRRKLAAFGKLITLAYPYFPIIPITTFIKKARLPFRHSTSHLAPSFLHNTNLKKV
jgi:hypothetical protein